MEQKRTIWIVLAAGIFLSVVLGAAVILYASEAKKNTTALYQRSAGSVWMSPETAQQKHTESFSNEIDFPSESPAEESSINPAEVNDSSVTSNIESPAEGKTSIENSDSKIAQTDNVTVISTGNTSVYNVGDTSTTTIDLNALKNTASASSNVTAQNKAAETAIRETNAVHRNVEKTSPVVEKKISSPKASASSNKKSVSSKSSAQVSSAPKKSAPAKKVSDRFWVQAGSYTTTKNADEARGILESNKIPCEVFTFTDAKGVLHYRVRVGPYTTKSEAEYWKQRIDTISLFAKNGTYVTNTSAAK
ncbi:SPOR domain-containing protein [Treponema succinifaciens]|uniref:SPOR domain-containing protein n=1 Tax=Treponema succinifaciens TaxID=167 RepID=UPI003FEEB251